MLLLWVHYEATLVRFKLLLFLNKRLRKAFKDCEEELSHL